MNEPEIARRCLTCGASIRKRAQFCPQCGEALVMRIDDDVDDADESNKAAESLDTIVEMRTVDPVDAENKPTMLLDPDLVNPTKAEVAPDLSKTLPLDAAFPPAQPPHRDGGVGLKPGGSRDKTRPLSGKQVTGPPSTGTPVQKLMKVSSVVLDQAAYDPSVRFLLVAAVLFILFLFLLIMSKILS